MHAFQSKISSSVSFLFNICVICHRATQFRWIQKEGTGERQSWGVDHVYIGEACPGLCSGHGYCTSGVVCICDEGHHGGQHHWLFWCLNGVDIPIIQFILDRWRVNICRQAEKMFYFTCNFTKGCLYSFHFFPSSSSSSHQNRGRLLPLQQRSAQLHQGQLWVWQCVPGELAVHPGRWCRQWLWAAVATCSRRLALF